MKNKRLYRKEYEQENPSSQLYSTMTPIQHPFFLRRVSLCKRVIQIQVNFKTIIVLIQLEGLDITHLRLLDKKFLGSHSRFRF